MQDLTQENKSNLDNWYNRIKHTLTTKAEENFRKRLQEITNIVNRELSQTNYKYKLIINESDKSSMWNGIAGDIDNWKGVEITACTKIKTNYKSYAITSRNWWNRNKAKIYGNHFFYPMIFCHIKQLSSTLNNLNHDERAAIFVNIFDEILHAKIQFPQTRAQPIIPHQSFIQPNKFKFAAIELLKKYGIQWDGKNIEGLGEINHTEHINGGSVMGAKFSDDDTNSTSSNASNHPPSQPKNSYYIKDKDRSLKVNKSYIDCLDSLKQRLNDLNASNSSSKHNKIKIKRERSNSNNAISSYSQNQYNPPSVRNSMQKNHKNGCKGINITKMMKKDINKKFLNQKQQKVNLPPIIQSIPTIPNNLPTLPNIQNIPNFNLPNINIQNHTIDLPSLLNGCLNELQMNGNNHNNHMINNNNINFNNHNTNFMNMNMNNNPNNINMGNMANNATVDYNSLNNNLSTFYGAYRGQSNSVSNLRYSPLPVQMSNLYCSIRTDPMSGKLVLSLHIPLDC